MKNFWFQFKSRCFNPFWNLITMFITIFIRRDKKIALFGGRNRNSFAGNSRFVFQYLAENKSLYGFSHVVWVTESDTVMEELNRMGYECYAIHSRKSIYYHLKAGYHLISYSFTPEQFFVNKGAGMPPDILVNLSWGAKCIDLAHFVELPKDWKNVENTLYRSAFEHFAVAFMRFIQKSKFINTFILYAGGWGNREVLATNTELVEAYKDENVERVITTSYPALCKCVRYTPSEEVFFNGIQKQYSGMTIILYTPTYRMFERSGYQSPLEFEVFRDFLLRNNCLWVEKLHSKAKGTMKSNKYDNKVSFLLEDSFDMNVLAQWADILVTDYSSTFQKAVYLEKPFAFWCGDLEEYNKNDYGLGEDFLDYAGDMLCTDIDMFIADLLIKLNPNYVESNRALYEKGKELYYNYPGESLETICTKVFCE